MDISTPTGNKEGVSMEEYSTPRSGVADSNAASGLVSKYPSQSSSVQNKSVTSSAMQDADSFATAREEEEASIGLNNATYDRGGSVKANGEDPRATVGNHDAHNKKQFARNTSNDGLSSSGSVSSKQDEDPEKKTNNSDDDDNNTNNDNINNAREADFDSPKLERRSSKRRRISAFAKRFTPGEGGGLAHKKKKEDFAKDSKVEGVDIIASGGMIISGGSGPNAEGGMDPLEAVEDDDVMVDKPENELSQSQLIASTNETNINVKIKGLSDQDSETKKKRKSSQANLNTVTSSSKGQTAMKKIKSSKSTVDAKKRIDMNNTGKKGSSQMVNKNDKKASTPKTSKKPSKVLSVEMTTTTKKKVNQRSNTDAIQIKWPGPSYRWVDDAVEREVSQREEASRSNKAVVAEQEAVFTSDPDCTIVEHQGLEIDFGGNARRMTSPSVATLLGNNSDDGPCSGWVPPIPFVVRPGDTILLSSADVPWEELNRLVAQAQSMMESIVGPSEDSDFNGGLVRGRSEQEDVAIYDDPASGEPGIDALDPFIARIERMWEEIRVHEVSTDINSSKKASGKAKNNGTDIKFTKTDPNSPIKELSGNKESKIMVRCRWYFKKEDVEGLSGKFVIEGQKAKGDTKQKILAAMTPRDLILTDLMDDNPALTILAKAQVVKGKPLMEESNTIQDKAARGAFICRYEIKIRPPKSSGKEGTVILTPYEDETDGEIRKERVRRVGTGLELTHISGSERAPDCNLAKEMVESTNNPDSNDVSSDDEKGSQDDGSENYRPPTSPMRVLVSEGANKAGKIQVGPDFQAVVPLESDMNRKSCSQRRPVMVWDPIYCSDRRVDDFLEEACAILKEHMTAMGINFFHDVNGVESPDPEIEMKKPREFNIDCLLAELHANKYSTRAALRKVSENPGKFITLWSDDQKDKFDANFRTYREALRMISKNMNDSKSCKDIIDYHYRFKLPENFRRFKVKKREQAQRMMKIVEDRVLNEKLAEEARKGSNSDSENSDEDVEGISTPTVVNNGAGGRVGAVNNRIRTWFRCGGRGKGAVGATQLRRNQACEVLTQIREEIGVDAYLTLAKRLKAYNSKSGISLDDVKNSAEDIMKMHPTLLNQFMLFFPKEMRGTPEKYIAGDGVPPECYLKD
mmetsp:Transcript_23162/g.47118  ORF Transcript_23162/g.47118 Transcript_23162/m.47118 type:complete len:1143 (+) Transcript_23162:632-4060(+)